MEDPISDVGLSGDLLGKSHFYYCTLTTYLYLTIYLYLPLFKLESHSGINSIFVLAII